MLTTTKVYKWSLDKYPLIQKINILPIQAIRSGEWLNCFFIFKSYNFVIYISGQFYNMLLKYGLVLPTKNLKSVKGKKKQKEQWWFVWMPHAEWTFQHVGIGSMRFSILTYAEEPVTQFFAYGQGILRHFKRRMLWCVILLPM